MNYQENHVTCRFLFLIVVMYVSESFLSTIFNTMEKSVEIRCDPSKYMF